MSEPVAIAVPQMNPNDEHAVLVRWHVESGSRVAEGDPLATLETTKATFDVNAPGEGFVFFDIEPNTMLLVGSTLAVLSDSDKAPTTISRSRGDAGSSGVTGSGPITSTGDHGATAHTTAQASEQRFTRKALHLMKEYGLTAAHFSGSARIDTAEVERVAQARANAFETRDRALSTATGPAQPSALGSGARSAPEAMGTHSPANAMSAQRANDTDSRRSASVPRPLTAHVSHTGGVESLAQPPAKLIEARMLAEVYREVVPSTVSVSLSCERVDAHLRELATRSGPISLLELAIYQCARILADFPELNGFHADGRAWRYRDVAIGFAINLGKSLRVPVVRRTAELSQLDIARVVRDLSLRYMRDELTLDELTDGTFTITDLSSSGVVQFVPVLNHRQAAILGICAERPGAGHRDLVLTFDHRMADGVRAAQFLGELRDRIEQPPA